MKRLSAILLAIAVFVTLVSASGYLLMPVRSAYGATWDAYLCESENTVDILFIGTSMVYCDVIPEIITRECGDSAYVMAGPAQTIPITYYYLREAVKTQKPKTVVMELTGMFFDRYMNYTVANIGYMPWSLNRIRATAEAAEPDALPALLFPIYSYHDRIYTVSLSEIRERLHPSPDPERGYTRLKETEPQEETSDRDFSAETENYRRNLSYLHKISEYCDIIGAELILYIAPACSRIPSAAAEKLISDLEEIHHAAFFDCNDGTWRETNAATDWYDSRHFNENGAAKFSEEFGQRLKNL